VAAKQDRRRDHERHVDARVDLGGGAEHGEQDDDGGEHEPVQRVGDRGPRLAEAVLTGGGSLAVSRDEALACRRPAA